MSAALGDTAFDVGVGHAGLLGAHDPLAVRAVGVLVAGFAAVTQAAAGRKVIGQAAARSGHNKPVESLGLEANCQHLQYVHFCPFRGARPLTQRSMSRFALDLRKLRLLGPSPKR